MLILDGSRYDVKNNAKLPELFDKYTIIKGFNYQCEFDNISSLSKLTSQQTALMTEEHISKQIEF